jgi:hypothetical protein
MRMMRKRRRTRKRGRMGRREEEVDEDDEKKEEETHVPGPCATLRHLGPTMVHANPSVGLTILDFLNGAHIKN